MPHRSMNSHAKLQVAHVHLSVVGKLVKSGVASGWHKTSCRMFSNTAIWHAIVIGLGRQVRPTAARPCLRCQHRCSRR